MNAQQTRPAALKRVAFATTIENAHVVSVLGDFTTWEEHGISLVPGPSGDWRATLKLPPGEYEYRLRVDGQWKDHPEADRRVPNAFGTENCVLTVRS